MRELQRSGIEVHVALPGGHSLRHDRYLADVTAHDASLDFPRARPWRFPAVARRLRALVDEIQPDLIHSHFVGTTLTMRLALGRRHPIPRIFQVPGPLHLEHRLFRAGDLASAGPGDYWIAACRWTRDAYRRSRVAADRVFLSYYGVDVDEVRPRAPGTLRAELGLSAGTPIVGMVAYMYPPKRYLGQRTGIKGHEDLIEATALCLPRFPDLRLVLVGGPWIGGEAYERRLKDLARRRLGSSAVFLGTRYDVPDLYADFDVVVHPSHTENLGGAVESLMLGVPTIATDVGGFPDLISPGETGWLVPPKSPGELAVAIGEALAGREEALAMARNGRERAQGLFDVRAASAPLPGIYGTILERS
jgi:glycosyltransferase involved in cell wall biosynthesis